jgi:hypothetical protein
LLGFIAVHPSAGKTIAQLGSDSQTGDGMTPLDSTRHSFILKVWLEEDTEEAACATWRGQITHVTNGDQRYLQDLDEIRAFVALYLEEMGIKVTYRWPVRECLRRLWASLGGGLLR